MSLPKMGDWMNERPRVMSKLLGYLLFNYSGDRNPQSCVASRVIKVINEVNVINLIISMNSIILINMINVIIVFNVINVTISLNNLINGINVINGINDR